MPIAATRSSVDVRAKPFFQNTGMARRRATSLSNSLGRAMAGMMAVVDRIVKNVAIRQSFRASACPCDLIGQLFLTQRKHWIDSRSAQCWQICSHDDHRRHRDDDDKDCGTV